MTEFIRSDSRMEAVAKLLPSERGAWWVPGATDTLRRETMLERLEWVRDANSAVLTSGDDADSMTQDYEQSVDFVHQAFDEFESETVAIDTYDSAFLVPARGEHASEVTPFLPLLDEKYGITADQMHRTVAHLAPTKIETYQGDGSSNGVMIYTPAYFDPLNGTDRTIRTREIIPAAKRRVDEAARLVRQRYNVGLVGLGAVIPSVTSMGRSIREPGLVTTTGHGGTVHIVSQVVERVIEARGTEPRVGMLGLGAIGGASLDVIRASPMFDSIRQIALYDERTDLMLKNLSPDESTTVGVGSEVELLESSDIIVTAITATIDLDAKERELGREIDLTGKVIVDDSQPGCFDRQQVEARGGTLVWVVGSDESESGFLRRTGGYAFGARTGLHGDTAVWGCEAEVGSLALLARPELAIRGTVTPEIAREIGRVCMDAGIRAAWPLQSFGQPVEF